MVKMTCQNIPVGCKINSLLDYGCAEGAITAELGRQLGLQPHQVFGADVRYLCYC